MAPAESGDGATGLGLEGEAQRAILENILDNLRAITALVLTNEIKLQEKSCPIHFQSVISYNARR